MKKMEEKAILPYKNIIFGVQKRKSWTANSHFVSTQQ